jgi:hypothetical protein
MMHLFRLAILLVPLGLSGGAADRPGAPAADNAPVHVDNLIEVFQTNEVRAAALYADKVLDLSGRVSRVITSRYGRSDRDRSKDAYLVELQIKALDVSRISVQCFFDEAERDKLAGLKMGQEVIIRGMCAPLVVYTGDYKRGDKDYIEVPFHYCKVVGPK